MRRTVFPIVLLALSTAAAPTGAEAPAVDSSAAPVAANEAVASEPAPAATDVQPAAAPTATEAVASVEPKPAPAGASEVVVQGKKTIVLGPQGVDDQGRVGRLHTVSRGDTLWDLSAAYLGTPWVWPSVWIDNDDIANPHLIRPGDRIWITANEMRVVSDDEADAFLERLVGESAAVDETEPVDEAPAAPAELEESMPSEEPVLAAVAPPVEVGRKITVSTRAAMGFVSAEQLDGASSIVDSPVERVFLTDGDRVYLGLGEGDTQVGDRFTIFEVVEDVRDVGTNRLLGHHVDVLGWVEVRELTGDTSIGEIRMSYSEIPRGARLLSRPPVSRYVSIVRTPEASEGRIVFMPGSRTVIADGEYVYLNRGELDGLEIGSELEVVNPGKVRNDAPRDTDVQTPDHKVATLVVVSTEPQTAVAYVLNASRELEVGDTVRPTAARLAAR